MTDPEDMKPSTPETTTVMETESKGDGKAQPVIELVEQQLTLPIRKKSSRTPKSEKQMIGELGAFKKGTTPFALKNHHDLRLSISMNAPLMMHIYGDYFFVLSVSITMRL